MLDEGEDAAATPLADPRVTLSGLVRNGGNSNSLLYNIGLRILVCLHTLFSPLTPNPPKDTDGRREDSGRVGEGATGEMAGLIGCQTPRGMYQ